MCDAFKIMRALIFDWKKKSNLGKFLKTQKI